MGGEYCDQLAEGAMAEAWKQWEGQAVNGELRLGEYLGGSSRGAVFELQSDDPNFPAAAIKLIAEDSPHAENRFASWRFASTLSHPNLIRILQSGRCQIGDAKLLYVVMERADEDLSQIIPRRALTENEAREMLEPALGALAYLHSNGLAHGHIKPANIMASGDQLKLSSDGVCRAGEPIEDASEYDPPEATKSPAGDVWSLGMTLVEILTGRLPAWDRNAGGDPETPETLPSSLLHIARHCLRRDPARRWTITEIAEGLRPAVAAPRIEQQPVLRNATPGNGRYLTAALVLLLASSGFVAWKLLSHTSRRDARLPHAAAKLAKSNLPEPRPVKSAAPVEKKPATVSDEHSPSGASPKPVAASPAPPKIPEAAEAISGVTHQVLPEVPQKSLATIRGTVRVGIAVSVDPSGHVSDATIDSPGPSVYFANLALEAAKRWRFARVDGSSSDWTVQFEFSPDGTKASATQSAP
jgi:TonB family protein